MTQRKLNLRKSIKPCCLPIVKRRAPRAEFATSRLSATKSTKSLSVNFNSLTKLSVDSAKNFEIPPANSPFSNLTQARPLAPFCLACSVSLSIDLREYLSAAPLTTIALTTSASWKTLKSTVLASADKSVSNNSKRVSGLSEP